ncbi:ornithine carbamoyltransferase [Myxacorys almedinensis]|uniref:Ornithine carbamoyltransferase n=1 Tax=Myxacorys almedinensis A TaxID=2690445 RepID=A0A8J7Z6D3_9CYAN|nr:ornithine carbamoyltransferase [Myxacorys almedinensis]NDJ18991.1 ornithine carbamoyltransferase [Myxacorys almedinensis A]
MGGLKGRDLLSLADLSSDEMKELLDLAAQLKAGTIRPRAEIEGRAPVLGLLFYKASTRTRVSFSTAMYHLGGQVLDLPLHATQVSRGEPLVDTARVLDRYLDILAIRTFDQQDLKVFADYAKVPVINALTDLEHPCQILADLQTIQETFGALSGLTLTYLGDGNNVAHSLLLGCALVGMNIRIAAPEGFQCDRAIVEQASAISARRNSEGTAAGKSEILLTSDPVEAVTGSHVLYTDVWASMGQEDLAESRIPVFQPYQVNDDLLHHADNEAIVLHCLPAHRGEEITDAVMEGAHSKVWDQAENRMHAQKALLASLLGAI